MSRTPAPRYRFIRKLGEGGLGEVHLVYDTVTRREVALKRLQPSTDRQNLPFLESEFRILSKLKHPHLVQVYDFGTDQESAGRPYITSEYIEGADIKTATEGIGWESILGLIIQLCRGLEYIHSRQIVHGDIKPQNVLVTHQDKQVKLLDFGLAQHLAHRFTEVGGTLAYMAPEALEGRPSPRSDLYSLGVLLHELLSRRLPAAPLCPLRELNPNLPVSIVEIVQRLLQPEAGQRFSTAHSVMRAINRSLPQEIPIETTGTSEASLYSSELIGREKEKSLLKESLDQREGHCIILLGEAGTGKSRLFREFKPAAQLQGIRVLHAVSLPEVFRQLRISEAKVSNNDKADPDESARFWQMASRLQERIREGKWLIQFGNIQDLEPVELRFLFFWLTTPMAETVSLAWWLKGRPSEFSGEVSELVSKIAALPQSHSIELAPFTPKQIREYLQAVTGRDDISDETINSLKQWTGGNPYHLVETLRAHLREDPRFELPVGKIQPAKSLETLLRRQFENLSLDQQQLLTQLSLWRQPVEKEALLTLLKWEESRLMDQVRPLVQRHLLVWSGNSLLMESRLLHDLIAEKVPRLICQREHRRIAHYLEKLYQGNPQASSGLLPELATHFLESGQKEGKQYALQAGRILEEQGFLERALHFYRKGDSPKGMTADPKILHRISILHRRLGQFEKALEAQQQIVRLCKRTDPAKAIDARIQIGLTHQHQGDLKKALRLYEELLDLPDGLSRVQRLHLLGLVGMAHCRKGDLSTAEKVLAPGLPEAERIWDDPAATFFNTVALVAYYRADYEKAIACYKKSLAIYEKIEAGAGRANVLNNLGLVSQQAHNSSEALRYYSEALELAEQRGNQPLQATLHGNLGTLHQERGEYANALKAYQKAEQIYGRLGMGMEQTGAWINLANLYTLFGTRAEAQMWIKKSLGESPSQGAGLSPFYEGYLASLSGDLAVLDQDFEKAISDYQAAELFFKKAEAAREIRLMKLNRINLFMEQGELKKASMELEKISPSAAEDLGIDVAIRYDWSVARLKLLKKEELPQAQASLQHILSFLRTTPLPEIQWEVAYAAGSLELAIRTIQQLARSVPEEFQADYLSHYKRKKILEQEADKMTTPKSDLPDGKGFQKLLALNRRLNSETDGQKLLELIMDSAIELTGARRGFLILSPQAPIKEFDWKQVRIARNFDQQGIPDKDRELSSSLVLKVLKEGEVILADNAAQDPRFQRYQSVHRLQLNSILAVPLKWSERVVGVIYLDHPMETHLFAEQDIPLVEMFAEFAVTALQKNQELKKLEESRQEISFKSRKLQRHLKDQSEELDRVRHELRRTKEEIPTRYSYENIVGRSSGMRQVFHLLDKVTEAKIPIVIYGESGTGKELIAKALHFNSTRKNAHFVSENCSAIPENLLESELFGHVKGAFTGADRDKEGLFRYAQGGTLFLDEIGDLPLSLQPKLLRILQEEAVRPVGGREALPIDVRIVSASHRDLKALVKEGKFRQDLFFRLAGLTVTLPPLRERREDIPLLIQHFLEKLSPKKKRHQVSPEALRLLSNYSWPGNVRELEHAVRNAVLFTSSGLINEQTFHFKMELFQQEGGGLVSSHSTKKVELSEITDERERVIEALRQTQNHKSKAAKLLGVSRKTLYNKLEKYRLTEKVEWKSS